VRVDTGTDGRIMARQTVGADAPLQALQEEYGVIVDKVVDAVRAQLPPERTAESDAP
jgi:hypothetical protein